MSMLRAKGMILVATLMMAAVLLILGVSLYSSGLFALSMKAETTEVYLADLGIEYARGMMQRAAGGGPLYLNSLAVPAEGGLGPARLTDSNGADVEYPMSSSWFSSTPGVTPAWKSNVQGIPVQRPVYDAGGNLIGQSVIGFFAFFLVGGTGETTDVYAIGAPGTAANAVSSFRTLHGRLKPITYTEYTMFQGNPNQTVALTPSYTDPFYNISPFRGGGAGPLYNTGDTVTGLGTRQSFSRIYVAGEMDINTGASGQQFTGFDMGAYHVPQNPVKVTGNPVNIRSTEQLFTNSASVGTGLPTADGTPGAAVPAPNGSSEVQRLMDGLKVVAENGGVYLDGNKFQLGEDPYYKGTNPGGNPFGNKFIASSEVPNSERRTVAGNTYVSDPSDPLWEPTTIKSYDPGTGAEREATSQATAYNSGGNDYYNNYYDIKLLSNGNVQIQNISRDYGVAPGNWSIKVNGSPQGYSGALNLPISSLNNHIIYLKGNAKISGTLDGRLTIVSEGKVLIDNNLTYADTTVTPGGGGTAISRSSPADDLLGIFTPRKVEIFPQNIGDQDNTILCGTVLALGSNPTSVRGQDMKWTIHLDPYYFADGSTKSTISFFGSQVYYQRDSTWKLKYRNGRTDISPTSSDQPVNPFQMYDQSLLFTQPPFTPAISQGYNIIYWAEVNKSGQDIRYHR